jgi:hypothetical protein
MMVKLKPKNKSSEYEGEIDKMKLPLLPHGWHHQGSTLAFVSYTFSN